MNTSFKTHLKNLRAALLSLPDTGEEGFEGLMGVALAEIAGVPFRLAGSGPQAGLDGKPAYQGDGICFECKLYKSRVSREAVLSKLAEISLNDETDLWVLGATSRITAQLADTVGEIGEKSGFAPPLAAALATAQDSVSAFLRQNMDDADLCEAALTALAAVRRTPSFPSHAERLKAQLDQPAIGTDVARRANCVWLSRAFLTRRRARRHFHQPLAPCEAGRMARPRKVLEDKVKPFLTEKPEGKALCVLGGEGHGKSWLVVQSWLSLETKPLMLVLTPEDFHEAAGQNDIGRLLIAKLVEQTGDTSRASAEPRWHRRLDRWRRCPAESGPRLVAVLDGVNQRPKTDWGRIIDLVGDELEDIGGRLIVTVRTPYYSQIKGRVTLPVKLLTVPEWTEGERDEILAANQINAGDLRPAVAASLCNPRLLGLALELLEKAEIVELEELTKTRLLFEHMRMSERDAPLPEPASAFARRLQEHAQEVMARAGAQQRDDLKVFDSSLEAVADGRFYLPIEGDPERCTLSDDGLILALGFSVIDSLRAARRNGRDLGAELSGIIEPVTALDDMATVILAALTITCVDETFSSDLATALICGFAELQNPDQDEFDAFAGLARTRPEPFLEAARRLGLADNQPANFDWIESALLEAGKHGRAWEQMAKSVRSWLSAYSLAPELGMFRHPARDRRKEVEKERTEKQKKIEEKLQALSPAERKLLDGLVETQGSLSTLARLALFLLAGKTLAPFAASLVNWSFANALNSSPGAPYNEFWHLIRLNRIDWSETRTILLRESAILRSESISRTGQWALVNVLRATGDPKDAAEAVPLVDELTKDRPSFGGRGRLEDYCAADPCDPRSQKPRNITNTAGEYRAIDVAKLRLSMSPGVEDRFFEEARPGLARFEPETVIEKHREFEAHVLAREELPLRQGLLELRAHNALLTREMACRFLLKRKKASDTGAERKTTRDDEWLSSQYCRLLAFPFLSSREQVDVLRVDTADEDILLDLMEVALPLEEAEFEELLNEACEAEDERVQYVLLAFAKYSGTPLSKAVRRHLGILIGAVSERVRAQALGIIARIGDSELLDRVVKSGWRAADAKTENGYEVWYGSAALLEAAANGLISTADVLDRISPRLLGHAAKVLGTSASREVALRIDASIHRAIGLEGNFAVPDVEFLVRPDAHYEPARYTISEEPVPSGDIKAFFDRLSESNAEFEKRQKRNYDAFKAFKETLSQAQALIIIDHLGLDEFLAIANADEGLADGWHALFARLPRGKLPAVHNLILLLAHALSWRDPHKAAALFALVRNSKPLVRFTFGRAGVPLDARAVWAAADYPVIDGIRADRLDKAGSDEELAVEVLAGLQNGKSGNLENYVTSRLESREPAEIARGLMVAGFSDRDRFNEEALARFEKSAGFLKTAHKAAHYAYERNVWARHWFGRMCGAEAPADFWRWSVLFTKIVDGRFETWRHEFGPGGSPMQVFGSSLRGKLENRFKKWGGYRAKKLFGDEVPHPTFLQA